MLWFNFIELITIAVERKGFKQFFIAFWNEF